MKVLHTSDWHLGRTLYGQKRYTEFGQFLAWILQTIAEQQVDILLIAGDVFDSSMPSNKAQELYYHFLYQISQTTCRHVVIIAGNHDSPSFLNAPKALLHVLNVHVVGAMSDQLHDEVLVLRKAGQGTVDAIVCAVPYLRDKDLRTLVAGEGIDAKNAKLAEGLHQHYQAVCALAKTAQSQYQEQQETYIPLIGMGHLFAAGGQTVDGDGVRELYVGSLAQMGVDSFPDYLDYVALGHLHVPQKVGGSEHIRYCGSPIAMGFGEAKQQKEVLLIDFATQDQVITRIAVPKFQALARICGDLAEILDAIEQLKMVQSDAWLEIEYTGQDIVPMLRETLDDAISDSSLLILRIKNKRLVDKVWQTVDTDHTLDDLSPEEVFIRCLDSHAVPEESRADLLACYHDVLQTLQDTDQNKE